MYRKLNDCVFNAERCYSGKGWRFISGAKGAAASPTKKTGHMETPAKCIGSASFENIREVNAPSASADAGW